MFFFFPIRTSNKTMLQNLHQILSESEVTFMMDHREFSFEFSVTPAAVFCWRHLIAFTPEKILKSSQKGFCRVKTEF